MNVRRSLATRRSRIFCRHPRDSVIAIFALFLMVNMSPPLSPSIDYMSATKPHFEWASDRSLSLKEEWDAIQNTFTGKVQNPAVRRDYIRFSLPGLEGSRGDQNVQRAEVALNTANSHGFSGGVVEYRWTMRFADLPKLESIEDWIIVSQWHQTLPDCPPNIALQYQRELDSEKGSFVLIVRGGELDTTKCDAETTRFKHLPTLETGKWLRFKAVVAWSADSDEGGVTLWLDGEEVANLKNTPTLYEGMDAYAKYGVYRSWDDQPVAVDLRSLQVEVVRTGETSTNAVKGTQ